MKKILALSFLLCLLPCIAQAKISKAQFNSWSAKVYQLSYEQLIELNSLVQSRLFEESLPSDGVLVPPGEGYVVGVDIPAGSYRIVPQSSSEYDSVVFDIDYHDGGYSHTHLLGFCGSSEIGKIELSQGATVNIIGGFVCFFPYTGIFH